jgi:hypothetical protein
MEAIQPATTKAKSPVVRTFAPSTKKGSAASFAPTQVSVISADAPAYRSDDMGPTIADKK